MTATEGASLALDTPYEELDALKAQVVETHDEEIGRLVFAQGQETYDEARRLVAEINSAITQLERVRDDIVRNPLKAHPNTLGILQSHSSSVESAVGRFTAAKDAYNRVLVAVGLREPGIFA